MNFPLRLNQLPTPSLLFYPHIIQSNIDKAIKIAGGAERLRPHVKTHKSPHIVKMFLRNGVEKFKCATLAEADMLAAAGAQDILIAYPQTGSNINALTKMAQRHPNASFAVIGDDCQQVKALAEALKSQNLSMRFYIDLNVGQNRTGIVPEKALNLALNVPPPLILEGLHAYDGHIHEPSLAVREKEAEAVLQLIGQTQAALKKHGLAALKTVAGGTPCFAVYARKTPYELSPGTFVLQDRNYQTWYPDLNFEPAAFVLSRVASKPAAGLFTLDLGYKAVSADSKPYAAYLTGLTAQPLAQSEEHWSFKELAGSPALGQTVLALPGHICPTCALYDYAYCINETDEAVGLWPISGRARVLDAE